MGNSTMQQQLLSIRGWRGFNNPWMPEADKDVDYSYINLLDNPERYTGYKVGHTALPGSWRLCSGAMPSMWSLTCLHGRAAIPAVGTAQAAGPLCTLPRLSHCALATPVMLTRPPLGAAASVVACLPACSVLLVAVQAAHPAKPPWPLSWLVSWGCSTQLPHCIVAAKLTCF